MTSKKKSKKSTNDYVHLTEEVKKMSVLLLQMQSKIVSLEKNVKLQNRKINNLQQENKAILKKMLKLTIHPSQSNIQLTDNDCDASSNIVTSDDEKQSLSVSLKTKSKQKKKSKPLMTRRMQQQTIDKSRNSNEVRSLSWQSGHPFITVGDNGSSAIKPKFKGGSIRFGKYLSLEKDSILKMRIKIVLRSIGNASSTALGFATEEFGDYGSSNFGNNYSCIVKGNGMFLTSKQFKNEEYEHKTTLEMFANKDDNVEFFKEGNTVVVEIDFEEQNGRMWNETIKNESKIFCIEFPKRMRSRKIAVIAYMAGSQKKRIVVVDQEYIY